MIIEWLTFQVEPDWHDLYLTADAEIWTRFLSNCPGFLGKQVWQNPDRPDEITLVIQWQNREDWKTIDPNALAQVEHQFVKQFGRSFKLLEAREYKIR